TRPPQVMVAGPKFTILETNPDGTFVLEFAEPGEYKFAALAPEFSSNIVTILVEKDRVPMEVEIPLFHGGRIRITVDERRLETDVIRLVSASGNEIPLRQDDDGEPSLSASDIPPGSYTLVVESALGHVERRGVEVEAGKETTVELDS
ncbi:MAG: hypothetical protein V2A76_05570, partial [Planctomycetota bacterium]